MAMRKIKALLHVYVETEIDDDEADSETLRYLVEQDLEDKGFEVEVTVI
jgi:hypothetical protein